jgi:hypothetical protein
MENENHKGSEYNNIIETWEQNERNRQNGNAAAGAAGGTDETTAQNDLEQVIKQEANEYDNVNKEDRVLSGDRATVNDDPEASSSE